MSGSSSMARGLFVWIRKVRCVGLVLLTSVACLAHGGDVPTALLTDDLRARSGGLVRSKLDKWHQDTQPFITLWQRRAALRSADEQTIVASLQAPVPEVMLAAWDTGIYKDQVGGVLQDYLGCCRSRENPQGPALPLPDIQDWLVPRGTGSPSAELFGKVGSDVWNGVWPKWLELRELQRRGSPAWVKWIANRADAPVASRMDLVIYANCCAQWGQGAPFWKESRDFWLKMLHGPNPVYRLLALAHVHQYEDRIGARDAYVAALDSDDVALRQVAIWGLENLGGEDSSRILAQRIAQLNGRDAAEDALISYAATMLKAQAENRSLDESPIMQRVLWNSRYDSMRYDAYMRAIALSHDYGSWLDKAFSSPVSEILLEPCRGLSESAKRGESLPPQLLKLYYQRGQHILREEFDERVRRAHSPDEVFEAMEPIDAIIVMGLPALPAEFYAQWVKAVGKRKDELPPTIYDELTMDAADMVIQMTNDDGRDKEAIWRIPAGQWRTMLKAKNACYRELALSRAWLYLEDEELWNAYRAAFVEKNTVFLQDVIAGMVRMDRNDARKFAAEYLAKPRQFVDSTYEIQKEMEGLR